MAPAASRVVHSVQQNDEKGIEDIDDNPHMLLRLSSDDDIVSMTSCEDGRSKEVLQEDFDSNSGTVVVAPAQGISAACYSLDFSMDLQGLEGLPQSLRIGSTSLTKRQSKIVISDVDGTITKSDLLGRESPPTTVTPAHVLTDQSVETSVRSAGTLRSHVSSCGRGEGGLVNFSLPALLLLLLLLLASSFSSSTFRQVADEQFNAYNYWKLEPFPAISA
eukprot:451460-Hanusia_phi.AAC.5